MTTQTLRQDKFSLDALVGPIDNYIPTIAKPWNAQRVQHLYSRIGFGGSHEEIQQGLLVAPDVLVDQLVNAMVSDPLPVKPFWAEYTSQDYEDLAPDMQYEHSIQFRRDWIRRMISGQPKAKLTLFWSNHFVTSQAEYGCNKYLWDYFETLHNFSTGNFRDFVVNMGKCSAMLVYLNNNLNIADEPNENYARELMELFTLGEGNGYTQADIPEVARALTGWRCNQYECTEPVFDIDYFDSNPKTIFGTTANYDYNSLHELLFTSRKDQIANFICGKLYKYFIYPTVDQSIVSQLAQTFKDSNFELAPVLRQMFKSEHFFEQRFINADIKDPMSGIVRFARSLGFTDSTPIPDDFVNYYFYMAYNQGQILFEPPNVAGWKGHRAWINESTLARRWNDFGGVIYTLADKAFDEQYRNLAIALSGSTNDPFLIAQAMATHILNSEIKPEHVAVAVLYFKAGIPENYFQDGSWNIYWDEAPYQLRNLLFYLTRLPEFQLV